MSILDIVGDVRNRKIVLYGEKEEVQKFLTKYKAILNIQYIVSEYMDEVRNQFYEQEWGLRTVSFEEASFDDKPIVVICTKRYYSSFVKRLLYSNHKEYLDYISEELVECVLHKKKLLVCMGTQLMKEVAALLSSSKAFSSIFHVVYFGENELAQPYLDRMPEAAHLSRYCDVYLASSCETEKYNIRCLDGYLRNEDCITIKVSDYGFGGYYPQFDNNRNRLSDYFLREHERIYMDYETLAFSHLDKELFARCKNGVSKEVIVQELLDDKLFDLDAVVCKFDEEISRFAKLEKDDDIKLSDFIAQHRNMRLCRNLYEWNEPVVSYVANSFLDKLNMSMLETSIEERTAVIEEVTQSEAIIYPSVEKALKLDGRKDMYKVVTYYSSVYMGRDNYIQYQIDYLIEAYKLMHYSKMYLDVEK